MARVQANETFFKIFCQNASNPLCLVQSTCFGRCRTIWLPHVDRCKIRSWDAFWARVWADETVVEFFSQNTSNPLLKVQNLVSHHLVAASATLRNRVLGCRLGTSLGRRNYCRVFWPKCIQSTTLGPRLMFWVVSHHLVTAGAPLRNRVQGCRFGTSSGQRNFFQDFPPKRIQSTTLCRKLMFWVVSHHLVAASAALPNRVLGCCFGTSLG